MSIDDLVEFLRARLDEDEHEAPTVHEMSNCASHETSYDQCDCGWPARVLRDVEAKRAILAEHQPISGRCRRCGPDAWNDFKERLLWPCPTFRAAAAVYSDHRDYRPEWALG
jgi:hypothetical protein